jgi:hypothetical protein
MVWRDGAASRAEARLAVTILRKRALSSPAAAARSLARRLQLLSSRGPAPRQLVLFDEDAIDDELPDAALAAPGLADGAMELKWLRALVDAANAAAVLDAKLAVLQRLLRRSRESAVVFTEYRDTLIYLAARLPGSLQLHGGLSPAERTAVQARFNDSGGVLLATDAAAEGLNLQGQCRLVVNYELPWSPGRLEQRIGRVDRIGQRRVVHAVSLVARDTAEDLVVANLVRRLDRVAAAMGPHEPGAALLDATRVARLAIAGEDDGPAAKDVPEPPAFTRAAAADVDTAGRLASQAIAAPDGDPLLTLAGSLRAGAIPADCAIAWTCSAVTVDGEVAARRVAAAHLAGDFTKPRTARDARQIATRALVLAPAARVPSIDPSIDPWFAEVCAVHQNAVDRQLERERHIRQFPASRSILQPGLFDRRALHDAERDSAIGAALAAEHERRIAALERRRALTLMIEPRLVLILWH